jgi:hypothetical protein
LEKRIYSLPLQEAFLYMNAEYQSALSRLKNTIEVLISQHERITADNIRLAKELSTYKTQIDEYKTTTTELEQKVNRLQLAQAFTASSPDAKEARQKIGKLVREIDKCIALLNR